MVSFTAAELSLSVCCRQGSAEDMATQALAGRCAVPPQFPGSPTGHQSCTAPQLVFPTSTRPPMGAQLLGTGAGSSQIWATDRRDGPKTGDVSLNGAQCVIYVALHVTVARLGQQGPNKSKPKCFMCMLFPSQAPCVLLRGL